MRAAPRTLSNSSDDKENLPSSNRAKPSTYNKFIYSQPHTTSATYNNYLGATPIQSGNIVETRSRSQLNPQTSSVIANTGAQQYNSNNNNNNNSNSNTSKRKLTHQKYQSIIHSNANNSAYLLKQRDHHNNNKISTGHVKIPVKYLKRCKPNIPFPCEHKKTRVAPSNIPRNL